MNVAFSEVPFRCEEVHDLAWASFDFQEALTKVEMRASRGST